MAEGDGCFPPGRMIAFGKDGCPDEIRCARHGHEFHGVKMNRMKNSGNMKEGDILERNKNLNRGFRKLKVWRDAVELYAFESRGSRDWIDLKAYPLR